MADDDDDRLGCSIEQWNMHMARVFRDSDGVLGFVGAGGYAFFLSRAGEEKLRDWLAANPPPKETI